MSIPRRQRRPGLLAAVFLLVFSAPRGASDGMARAAAAPLGLFTLSGTIYADGVALSGATITLLSGAPSVELDSTVTDALGKYSFPVDNGTYDLLISPPPGSGLTDSVVEGIVIDGASVTQNVILLRGAIRLSGVVRDGNGAALDGVSLYFGENNKASPKVKVVTDPEGAYSVDLPSGTYDVDVEGRDAQTANATIPDYFKILRFVDNLPVTGSGELDVTLEFVTLSGHVVDNNGAALPETKITAAVSQAKPVWCNSTRKTDANGDYSLVLWPRAYEVRAYPPSGHGLASVEYSQVSILSSMVFDIALPKNVKLSGTVRNGEGTALDALSLFITGTNGASPNRTLTTDLNGSYTTRLAPGVYDIRITGRSAQTKNAPIPDYVQVQRFIDDLVLTSPTVRNMTLPFLTLSGKTVDGAGAPVGNVAVSAVNHASNPIPCNASFTSGASGDYSLVLWPGIYNVTGNPPPGPLVQTTHYNISVFHSRAYDIVLNSATVLSGVVSGRIQRESTSPLDNVELRIAGHSGSAPPQTAVTRADGSYQAPMETGAYDIQVTARSSLTTNARVPDFVQIARYADNLYVDGPKVYNLLLEFVRLSGKTTDSNGVPVPVVQILADESPNTPAQCDSTTVSDAQGGYALVLWPEKYDITITPPLGSGFATTGVPKVGVYSNMYQSVILNLPDTRAPRILVGPFVTAISDTTALVRWLTNEPATSDVQFTEGSAPSPQGAPGYSTIHEVQLTGLTPGTDYAIRAFSSDKVGNGPTFSAIVEFATSTTPDTVPPDIVEGPIAVFVSYDVAIIGWLTNEAATSVVQYGETSSLGASVSADGLRVFHLVTLTGLAPNTKYYAKALSTDASGNGPVESRVIHFRTRPSPDPDPPVIVSGPMAVDISDTAATIVWTTDEPATSGVSFNDGQAYGVISDEALVVDHAVRLTGLKPDTVYNYTAVSKDAVGNGPTLSDPQTFHTLSSPDVDPPIFLFGPRTAQVRTRSALIRWRTDEMSTSVVEYGTSTTLGAVEADTTLVAEHEIHLAGLEPKTRYFFRVLSTDAQGNGPSASGIYKFCTRYEEDGDPPVFLKGPKVVYRAETMAALFWRTDEPADAVVDYGATLPLDRQVSRMDEATRRLIWLVGLAPGRTYYYTVSATDGSGNTATAAGQVGAAEARPANAETGNAVLAFETTAGPDTTASEIVSGPEVVSVADSSAVIRWTTDEVADTRLIYGLDGQPLEQFAGDIAYDFEHLVVLTNLSPSTSYAAQAASADPSGNGPTLSAAIHFTTAAAPDTTAPRFAPDPWVSNITATQATVDWGVDEFAEGWVEYGTDPAQLLQTASTAGPNVTHEATLTRLQPSTTHYFRCVVFDAFGNRAESSVLAFDTSSESAPSVPSAPLPGDRAAGVPMATLLVWSECDRAEAYDVYLWRDGAPKPLVPAGTGLSRSQFVPPEALDSSAYYRWQVVAKNSAGMTAGPVWLFRTGSNSALNWGAYE